MHNNEEQLPNLSFIKNGFNIEPTHKPAEQNNTTTTENANISIKFGLQTKETLQKNKLQIFDEDDASSSSPIIEQNSKLPNMNEMLQKIKTSASKVQSDLNQQKSKPPPSPSAPSPTKNRRGRSSSKEKPPKRQPHRRKRSESRKKHQKRHSRSTDRHRRRSRQQSIDSAVHRDRRRAASIDKSKPKKPTESAASPLKSIGTAADGKRKIIDQRRRSSINISPHHSRQNKKARHSDITPNYHRKSRENRFFLQGEQRKRFSDSLAYEFSRVKRFARPRTPNGKIRDFTALSNGHSNRRKYDSGNNWQRDSYAKRTSHIGAATRNIGTDIANGDAINSNISTFVTNDNGDGEQTTFPPGGDVEVVAAVDPPTVFESVANGNGGFKAFSRIKDHKVMRKAITDNVEESSDCVEEQRVSSPEDHHNRESPIDNGHNRFKSVGKFLDMNDGPGSAVESSGSAGESSGSDSDSDSIRSSCSSSDRTTSMRCSVYDNEQSLGSPGVGGTPAPQYSRGYPMVCEVYSDDELADIDVGLLTSIPEKYRRVLRERFASITSRRFFRRFQQLIYAALKQNLPGVSFDRETWRFDFNMRCLPDSLVLSIERLVARHMQHVY